jgi:hypothetical protein
LSLIIINETDVLGESVISNEGKNPQALPMIDRKAPTLCNNLLKENIKKGVNSCLLAFNSNYRKIP